MSVLEHMVANKSARILKVLTNARVGKDSLLLMLVIVQVLVTYSIQYNCLRVITLTMNSQ